MTGDPLDNLTKAEIALLIGAIVTLFLLAGYMWKL